MGNLGVFKVVYLGLARRLKLLNLIVISVLRPHQTAGVIILRAEPVVLWRLIDRCPAKRSELAARLFESNL